MAGMGSGGGTKSLQKVVVMGNSGVGKTSLIHRFVTSTFSPLAKPTIDAGFSSKDVRLGDGLISLQVWDTAGQERFQALNQGFYRGADACVLVYDVSSLPSFERLNVWREQFIKHAYVDNPSEFPFVVLGNKADLEPARHAVPPASVKAWCDKHGLPHMLVSASSGLNVEEGFMTVVKAAAKRSKGDEPTLPDTLRLDIAPAPQSGCAC